MCAISFEMIYYLVTHSGTFALFINGTIEIAAVTFPIVNRKTKKIKRNTWCGRSARQR